MTYRVMVVEDEELILANIVAKIHAVNPDFQVVYQATNGLDAWEHIPHIMPHLLITDIQMPLMNGLELLGKVRTAYPTIECVILTGYSEFEYARQAMKMGLTEYLLKPVKPDKIKEILETVENHLSKGAQIQTRNILVSQINGSNITGELPALFKTDRFAIFLVCLGHVCEHLIVLDNRLCFKKCWDEFNILAFLNSYKPFWKRWWIVDDTNPNQKFIILSLVPNQATHLKGFGEHLKDVASQHLAPMIVNVCTSSTLITYEEIWSLSQKIRLHLRRNLLLGQSNFFIAEDPIPFKAEYKTNNYQGIILNLISSSNRDSIRKELEKLCTEWDSSQLTQYFVERQFFQLIGRVYQQFLPDSSMEFAHLEYEFSEKLSTSPNLMGIFDFILEIFFNLLQLDDSDIYNPQELVRRICTFINQNHTTPMSLESIAKSFHFNSSYLTKIFKKYTGETPLKYITDLKISKAKYLMETEPALSIKEISQAVGYYDPHYFSRIFKNITGENPSDYKKKLIKLEGE